MKKIEAIIRKSKFDEVKEALHEIEVNFFTYWDVTGIGNEKKGHVYRGVSYSTRDIARRHISLVVSDHFVEKTIMKEPVSITSLSIVSALSGVFSGFSKHVQRVAKEFDLDPRDI